MYIYVQFWIKFPCIKKCIICPYEYNFFHLTLWSLVLSIFSQTSWLYFPLPTYIYIYVYIYNFYFCFSVDDYLGWLYFLANVDMDMQVSIWYIVNSSTVEPYRYSLFFFTRNFHADFHKGYTNLHSSSQWMWIPLPSYPHQPLLSFFSWW